LKKSLALLFAGSWAARLIGSFVRMGFFGFFLLEVLNSSFFYLPLANELLMLANVREGRRGAVWVVYVLMASAGTVVGVFLLDLVARKMGEEGLKRLVRPRTFERLSKRIKKHAGWAVMFAAAMPPPFPFTPVMLTSSALQTPRRRMFPAVFAGRLIRFSAESALALYFGHRLLKLLNSTAFEYALYAVVAVTLVGSALLIWKWVQSGRDARATRRGGKRAATPART
jgi:membrane protein YqaA with SNARE-associated domain